MTVNLSVWQIVIAVLTLLGGGGGIVALVRVFTDRPKTRADAVKTITEASATSSAASAATVVALAERLEHVEDKADKQGDRIDEQDRLIGRLLDYVERVAGWSRRHEEWVALATLIARDHGREIGSPEPFPQFENPPSRKDASQWST